MPLFDLIALITFVLCLACVILNALFALKGKKPILPLAAFGVTFLAFALTGATAAGLPVPVLSAMSAEKPNEPDPDRFILQEEQIADDRVGPMDTQDLALLYGDLQSVSNLGGGAVEVKAKITLQKKAGMSVNQNFHNVEDLILLHGFDICQEIQYTGIATLQGGGDSRVISFTVKKSAIDSVMLGDMTGDTMRDWVEDLWISNNLGT